MPRRRVDVDGGDTIDSRSFQSSEAPSGFDMQVAAPRRQPPVIPTNSLGEPVEDGYLEFPKAMYRERPVSAKHPDGYQMRIVENEIEQAKLGRGWSERPPAPPVREDDPDDDE